MDEFFANTNDTSYVTPESLAWKLIMEDEIENFSSIVEAQSNDAACEFEILNIIYMEMIFNQLKINYMAQFVDEDGLINSNVDIDDILTNYKPDFRKYSNNEIIELFRDKFVKIRYYLGVEDITELCDKYDDNDFGPYKYYYSKILLLDDGRYFTREYFGRSSHIPEDKRYTFMLRNTSKDNQNSINKNNLNEYYSVVLVPSYTGTNNTSTNNIDSFRKLKISFSKYIVKD